MPEYSRYVPEDIKTKTQLNEDEDGTKRAVTRIYSESGTVKKAGEREEKRVRAQHEKDVDFLGVRKLAGAFDSEGKERIKQEVSDKKSKKEEAVRQMIEDGQLQAAAKQFDPSSWGSRKKEAFREYLQVVQDTENPKEYKKQEKVLKKALNKQDFEMAKFLAKNEQVLEQEVLHDLGMDRVDYILNNQFEFYGDAEKEKRKGIFQKMKEHKWGQKAAGVAGAVKNSWLGQKVGGVAKKTAAAGKFAGNMAGNMAVFSLANKAFSLSGVMGYKAVKGFQEGVERGKLRYETGLDEIENEGNEEKLNKKRAEIGSFFGEIKQYVDNTDNLSSRDRKGLVKLLARHKANSRRMVLEGVNYYSGAGDLVDYELLAKAELILTPEEKANVEKQSKQGLIETVSWDEQKERLKSGTLSAGSKILESVAFKYILETVIKPDVLPEVAEKAGQFAEWLGVRDNVEDIIKNLQEVAGDAAKWVNANTQGVQKVGREIAQGAQKVGGRIMNTARLSSGYWGGSISAESMGKTVASLDDLAIPEGFSTDAKEALIEMGINDGGISPSEQDFVTLLTMDNDPQSLDASSFQKILSGTSYSSEQQAEMMQMFEKFQQTEYMQNMEVKLGNIEGESGPRYDLGGFYDGLDDIDKDFLEEIGIREGGKISGEQRTFIEALARFDTELSHENRELIASVKARWGEDAFEKVLKEMNLSEDDHENVMKIFGEFRSEVRDGLDSVVDIAPELQTQIEQELGITADQISELKRNGIEITKIYERLNSGELSLEEEIDKWKQLRKLAGSVSGEKGELARNTFDAKIQGLKVELSRLTDLSTEFGLKVEQIRVLMRNNIDITDVYREINAGDLTLDEQIAHWQRFITNIPADATEEVREMAENAANAQIEDIKVKIANITEAARPSTDTELTQDQLDNILGRNTEVSEAFTSFMESEEVSLEDVAQLARAENSPLIEALKVGPRVDQDAVIQKLQEAGMDIKLVKGVYWISDPDAGGNMISISPKTGVVRDFSSTMDVARRFGKEMAEALRPTTEVTQDMIDSATGPVEELPLAEKMRNLGLDPIDNSAEGGSFEIEENKFKTAERWDNTVEYGTDVHVGEDFERHVNGDLSIRVPVDSEHGRDALSAVNLHGERIDNVITDVVAEGKMKCAIWVKDPDTNQPVKYIFEYDDTPVNGQYQLKGVPKDMQRIIDSKSYDQFQLFKDVDVDGTDEVEIERFSSDVGSGNGRLDQESMQGILDQEVADAKAAKEAAQEAAEKAAEEAAAAEQEEMRRVVPGGEEGTEEATKDGGSGEDTSETKEDRATDTDKKDSRNLGEDGLFSWLDNLEGVGFGESEQEILDAWVQVAGEIIVPDVNEFPGIPDEWNSNEGFWSDFIKDNPHLGPAAMMFSQFYLPTRLSIWALNKHSKEADWAGKSSMKLRGDGKSLGIKRFIGRSFGWMREGIRMNATGWMPTAEKMMKNENKLTGRDMADQVWQALYEKKKAEGRLADLDNIDPTDLKALILAAGINTKGRRKNTDGLDKKWKVVYKYLNSLKREDYAKIYNELERGKWNTVTDLETQKILNGNLEGEKGREYSKYFFDYLYNKGNNDNISGKQLDRMNGNSVLGRNIGGDWQTERDALLDHVYGTHDSDKIGELIQNDFKKFRDTVDSFYYVKHKTWATVEGDPNLAYHRGKIFRLIGKSLDKMKIDATTKTASDNLRPAGGGHPAGSTYTAEIAGKVDEDIYVQLVSAVKSYRTNTHIEKHDSLSRTPAEDDYDHAIAFEVFKKYRKLRDS